MVLVVHMPADIITPRVDRLSQTGAFHARACESPKRQTCIIEGRTTPSAVERFENRAPSHNLRHLHRARRLII